MQPFQHRLVSRLQRKSTTIIEMSVECLRYAATVLFFAAPAFCPRFHLNLDSLGDAQSNVDVDNADIATILLKANTLVPCPAFLLQLDLKSRTVVLQAIIQKTFWGYFALEDRRFYTRSSGTSGSHASYVYISVYWGDNSPPASAADQNTFKRYSPILFFKGSFAGTLEAPLTPVSLCMNAF